MNLKVLISPIIGAALLMSCGSGNQDAEKKAEPEKPKCDCSEVIYAQEKWNKGGLYTGLCETLDETNTVVTKREFINGILVFNWQIRKIGGKYITIDSVRCVGTKIEEGFQLKTARASNCEYVEDYTQFNAGKAVKSYIDFYWEDWGAKIEMHKSDGTIVKLNEDASQDRKTFLINGMKKANEIDSHFKILEMN